MKIIPSIYSNFNRDRELKILQRETVDNPRRDEITERCHNAKVILPRRPLSSILELLLLEVIPEINYLTLLLCKLADDIRFA